MPSEVPVRATTSQQKTARASSFGHALGTTRNRRDGQGRMVSLRRGRHSSAHPGYGDRLALPTCSPRRRRPPRTLTSGKRATQPSPTVCLQGTVEAPRVRRTFWGTAGSPLSSARVGQAIEREAPGTWLYGEDCGSRGSTANCRTRDKRQRPLGKSPAAVDRC